MKLHRTLSAAAAIAGLSVVGTLQAADTISLAGEWRFAIAPANAALFKSNLTDRVTLPGTTQSNRKGAEFKLPADQQKRVEADAETDIRHPLMNNWTPVHFNIGTAWYQRDVEIPAAWTGKRITLTLDRSKITRVWVDDKDCGSCDDIVTSHVYDLTDALTPGKHRLTILVTTGPFARGVGGHHLGGMQGNWNGIIGRIELSATAKTHIADVRVVPDVARKCAKLRIAIVNPHGGEVTVSAKAWNTDKPHAVAPKAVPVTGPVVELDYPLGNDAQLWDEFHPALYKLTVTFGGETFTTDVGLREFRRNGTVFTINGRTTFLRGTHDGCSFPITGYGPADVEAWLKVLRTAKNYGINHYRFHTWTPPEAAFAAADIAGIYMQPELPSSAGFSFGENKEHDDYARRMGEAILRKWANHPSFVMLALGNEIGVKRPEHRQAMTEMVSHFRALDPTRLYSEGSNNDFGRPKFNPNDDYWTTMRLPDGNGKNVPIRASFSGGNGWLNTNSPSTLMSYVAESKLCPAPLIGHEVGQYCVFPNLAERAKYTGVYRARNFDVIETRMRRHHVLEQNADFARASGALALICYREDIEAYLRTPGFGGFQLLDLVDYHGQGTSLVGPLDAFHESKGLITPEHWREFCSETVPLARFGKYTWTTDETFSAEIQVAHYGPAALTGVTPRWSLGEAGGELARTDIANGGVQSLGAIEVSLAKIAAPKKLTLEIVVGERRNRYPIWVYRSTSFGLRQPAAAFPQALLAGAPQQAAAEKAAAGCRSPNSVVRKLDDALAALEKGETVVFIPMQKDIEPCSVKCGFETVFWNFGFANQPPTMGILCDPKHALFAQFPTEFHANWQWFHIVTKARAMILDDLPAEFRPLVQVIDNIATCRTLGLIWEAKVGSGKLLVCTSDLPALQDKPEARQLLASLQRYAASPQFGPTATITTDGLRKLFSGKISGPQKRARPDE